MLQRSVKYPVSNRGFMLISIVVALALLPTIILVTMNVINSTASAAKTTSSIVTKQQLLTIRNFLVMNAKDTEPDGSFELLKEAVGDTVPVSVPVSSMDGWARPVRYCTWDIGTANADATYSQNVVAPPVAGMIGRLVSSGTDGMFQTICTSVTCDGDDLCQTITSNDVAYGTGAGSGWKVNEAGTAVETVNPSHTVGVSSVTDYYGKNISLSGNLTASNVVSGDNSTKTTQITDPNAALPSGFYELPPGHTNTPNTGTWWHLIHSRHTNTTNNYATQIITNFFNASESYTRIINNSTPTTWVKAGASGGSGYQAGSIFYWPGTTCPTGSTTANGAQLSRSDFSALYAVIGTIYGVGDGSTTFNLPDLRGAFVRAVDGGRGLDPGRILGSYRADSFASHNHSGTTDAAGNHNHAQSNSSRDNGSVGYDGIYPGGNRNPIAFAWSAAGWETSTAGNHAHNLYINNNGGTETAPKNVALLACIAY